MKEKQSLCEIIGGLITFLSSYFIEARRAARERHREEREHRITLQRAARLTEFDLLELESTLFAALEAGKWWPKIELHSFVTSWDSCRPILASQLSKEAWRVVSVA